MKKVHIAVGAVGAVALAGPALALAPHTANAATRIATCGQAPNHWTEFDNGGSITCFGYNGGTWNGTLLASKICGGNNYGFYSGDGPAGDVAHATFREGTTFVDLPETKGLNDALSAVHISDWAGTDTCG